MSNLVKRLDAHFVACAAAAGAAVVGTAQKSEAAIVYRNTPVAIPGTFGGVYLNVFTGGTGPNSTTPGYDLNPYYGGNALFQNTGASWVLSGTSAANLTAGTLIGPASTFGAGGGTAAGTPNFTAGIDGIIGFKFTEGTSNYYGWARLRKGASNTTAGQLTDYAFNDTPDAPINAGAVPAPGSVALLALGVVGLAGRRRK